MTKNQEAIPLRNAGLVLLNGYFPLLFDRLGLTENKQFTSESARFKAINILQFVATGQSKTEESYLPLNKILCGLSPSSALEESEEIEEHEKAIIEGLLSAAISHWSSIGSCSISGFRGNWLVRDGLLNETTDKWILVVDKRSYDLLIGKSPFSFSIIKYPWMEKPLHVTWPY